MIVHGIHPVREALEAAETRVTCVMAVPFKHNPRIQKIIDLARKAGIPVRFEDSTSLTRKTGNSNHQGILAELADAPYTTLTDLLQKNPRWLLLADGVEDPRNLGALIRTAEAAGMDGLLFPQRRAVQATATVVKASSGAALHFPLARIGNVVQAIDELKERGFWVAGLDMDGSDRIDQLSLEEPLLLIVGGENRGLRPIVKRACDFRVGLPMHGQVASLNLSVAAGILIYQILMKQP